MKVTKQEKEVKTQTVTFRLPKRLLEELTRQADKHDVSKQKLLAAILEQALYDKSFSVKVLE